MSIKQKLSFMKQAAKLEWLIFKNNVTDNTLYYKSSIKENGFRVKHIFWGFFLSLSIFALFISTVLFIVVEMVEPIFSKFIRSFWNLKLTR